MFSRKNRLNRTEAGKRQLKRFLLMFFSILILLITYFVHKAYRQLEVESFIVQRDQSEKLASQMDLRFEYMIERENKRTSESYQYLDVSQGKAEVSELSVLPEKQLMQGLIGYFQISHEGVFSSPLLPDQSNRQHPLVKLSKTDYQKREELVQNCFNILNNNQFQEAWGQSSQPLVNNYTKILDEYSSLNSSLGLQSFSKMPKKLRASARDAQDRSINKDVEGDAFKQESLPLQSPVKTKAPALKTQKLSDLNLDNSLQQQAAVPEATMAKKSMSYQQRSRRSEINVIAEKESLLELEEEKVSNRTIMSFAGEIDPLRFEVLKSGEFVFFRNIWRDGKRTIQGFVVQSEKLLNQMLREPLETHVLKDWLTLVSGFNGNLIYSTGKPSDKNAYFLLKHYVTSPFQKLELIFSMSELPPHSGEQLLNGLVFTFLVILTLGFIGIYRIGMQQIFLAQQHHDFVASVSHELKTPLTSIRMYGEMLRSNWVNEEKKKTYYDFIFFESERLSRLINNVLQLSKLSNPQNELELNPHSAFQLLDLIQSKISTQVEAAGFKLDMKYPDAEISSSVMVNEDAFSQIMINLVDNALKFSKDFEPKVIEVGFEIEENQVVFFVSDHGPGISKEQQKKIFDLFYRVEDELTRKTQGTGIGLALVWELAARMQAHLKLKTKAQGLEVRCHFSLRS
jgi:signal transduction histidine kinase